MQVGDQEVTNSWKEMETYFGRKAESIKDYFFMIDAKVAE